MTFNALTNRVSLALAALAVGLGVGGFVWQERPDDGTEAFTKLRRIGVALQLYRAEYGFKTVAERKSFADAGLPATFLSFTRPGHAWSLRLEDLQLSYGKYGRENRSSDFTKLYWRPSGEIELGAIAHYFALRGEKLPILSDEEWGRLSEPNSKVRTFPVLRLDGTVEWVRYDPEDWPGRLAH